ncbi:MAG: S8 family serine peptidase [Bacteroidales bacterium]|nr:S8 family serine peptidase [Bacteroidales bacterium]
MKLATVTRSSAKYLLAAILAVACTVQEPAQTQAPKSSEPVVSAPYAEGKAIILLDDDLAARVERDPSLLSDFDIESLERLFPYAGEFEERTRRAGLHRYYLVRFRDGVPATKAAASLETVPGIISAEPPMKVRRRAVFNDPLLSRQWHYINSVNPGIDINVKEVWENYTVGGETVIVSVVDEPVDATHPDLVDNLWKDSQGHTGYNFARDNFDLTIRPPASYEDKGDIGHGTHVAGTIAAVNNNGIGVCGVAGGDFAAGIPGVRLMSCAIFSGDEGATDAETARAFKWAADNGSVISQNSWGYYADVNNDGKVTAEELSAFKARKISSTLKAAIDYFIENAGCDNAGNQLPTSPMKGGLVFFAAGNENIDYDPICAYEPVISVGAFNEKDAKASYSNYGSWIDIAAPAGEGLASANSVWSTLPKNVDGGKSGYGGVGWVGTSMACPHASGVAALIVSYYGDNGFTAKKAREILFAGLGKTIGGTKPVGKKLDALASFTYGGVKDSNPLSLGVRKVSVHAHETKVLHLTVKAESGYTVTCTPGSDALVFDSATNAVTITGRDASPGTYLARFVLSVGGKEVYELDFQYILIPNHAPVVSLGSYKFDNIALGATGMSVLKTKPEHLGVLFEDEDGEELDVTVENSNPEVATLEDTGTKFTIQAVGYGLTTVTVKASDTLGETASFSFTVAVKDSRKGTGAEVFPETASDTVYIWPASDFVKKYTVDIYSSMGAKVLSLQEEGGLFHPIPVDITGIAPGLYTAVVTPKGESSQKLKFVKY